MELILFLLLIFLTFSAAYCSASEVALFSLSPHKVKAFSCSSDSREKTVGELLSSPRDLLVTVFMLNTVSNILLQNVASNIFQDTGGWALKVGFPLVLTLIFGEILPKYIALRNNVQLSLLFAPSVQFLQNILAPIRKWTIYLTTPISRAFFFYLRKEPKITKEEVSHALETAQKQSVLSHQEVDMVQGYLDLLDSDVKELMRPKEDILFYDIQTPLSKLAYLFSEEKLNRVPVCDKHIDNVIGVISAAQYFVFKDRIKENQGLLKLLDKPFFVPEQTSARVLLKKFYTGHQVMALVVDEYGLLTGLITLEDIAEVVIGNVDDSRDQKQLYTVAGKNELIVNGKMELSELNEIFDTELESENVVTIGGWLEEQLDGIPPNGTKLEKEGLLFHILTATPRKIERIYIRKKAAAPAQKKEPK